jgi:TolA-binding protein
MKGRTLMLMGDKSGAIAEFRAVIKRAPNSDLAAKAKAQLASLGTASVGKKGARKAR